MINSYLIKSSEPILIDTGMPVAREEFLSALWSLIDSKDLKWVLLTHDDADHSGALMEVLEAAPQARVYSQFIGLSRLETVYHMPVNRVGIVNPGDTLNAGGRELGILRPPLFDSPATNAIFDAKSGVLFTADSFGALIPSPAQDVSDVGEEGFYEGFHRYNRLNFPWFSLVDPQKFLVQLENIRRLEPKVIASSHAPMARGRTDVHLKAMARIPDMDPVSLPDQTVLDSILSHTQGGDGHHGS